MRREWVLILVFSCGVGPLSGTPAFAQTSGGSRTYVLSRETDAGSGRLPVYEYLDLDAVLGGGGSLSLNAGGWGRLEVAETGEHGDETAGELQYGYLSWRGSAGNRVARLGRQEVTGGVAVAERLDGLSAGGDLRGGFAVSAYAGVPVETERGGRDGDLLYGARLARRLPGLAELGLSYLRERDDGRETREEAGVDVFVHPHPAVSLEGRSTYSPAASAWMEHAYRLRLSPRRALTLTGDYEQVDYAAFMRSASVSAFLPGLEAGEEMRLLGAGAAYEITPALTASVSWKGLAYHVAGDAHEAGALLAYAAGPWDAGLEYARVSGDAPSLRYHRYRGYATRRFGRADAALELAALRYDEAIDGPDDAVTATLAAGYALRPNLRVAADATYVTDPVYRRDVRGLLKLEYGFALASGKP